MSEVSVRADSVRADSVRADSVRSNSLRHFIPLWIALLVALVHGLVYVVVVPPWQHYDEPAHFEYGWLIAHRQQLPQSDAVDLELRRELIRSMGNHGFYHDLGGAPDADALAPEQLSIGISQLDDPPGYYLWAAAWMWPVRNQSLETQLMAARLSSLALLLIIVGLGYATTAAITRPGSPLRWMVPLSLALLPSFVDLMTAVNNDAGAVLAASLLIYGMALLIVRGISWRKLLLLGLAIGLCWVTKRTTLPLLVFVPFVLLLGALRGRARSVAWAGLALCVLVALPVLFEWGDPAYWMRGSFQSVPLKVEVAGKSALKLIATAQQPNSAALQLFPREDGLPGSVVTVGTWMWASRPISAQLPMLFAEELVPLSAPVQVSLDTQPRFYAFTTTVPAIFERVYLIVRPSPVLQASDVEPAVEIYLQQIVVAKGQFPVGRAPVFHSDALAGGTWGNATFNNVVRNANLADEWPYLRPQWIERTPLGRTFEFGNFNLLAGVLDWGGAGWYFRAALENMAKSFWMVFGWGHVRMDVGWYPPLYVLVGLSGLGGGLALLRRMTARHPQVQLMAVAFLTLVTALIWSFTALRGIHSFIYSVFIPGARYAYVVIVPTLICLCAGLAEWIHVSQPVLARLRIPTWVFLPGIWLVGWLILDAAAIWRVTTFYAGR